MWKKTELQLKKMSVREQLEASALFFRLLRKHAIQISALGSATSREAKMLIVANIADAYLGDQQSRDDVARIVELTTTAVDLKKTKTTEKTINQVWKQVIEPCVQYLYRLGIINQTDIANLAWVKTNWSDAWQQTHNKEQQ